LPKTLRAMYRPPAWSTGHCSTEDVEFLESCIGAQDPNVVLEVGVAAGASSAALLWALDQLPDGGAARVLYSVDLASACYFNPHRAIGAAVAEMYPAYRARWELRPGSDARRIRAEVPIVDFAFVDANHSHPWPLLDVLHVASILRPRAWIALHDIVLPQLGYPHYGAQWLFEAWPFGKQRGAGGAKNIGVVELPRALADLVPTAVMLVRDRAWEATPRADDVDLAPVFAEVTAELAPRLRP